MRFPRRMRWERKQTRSVLISFDETCFQPAKRTIDMVQEISSVYNDNMLLIRTLKEEIQDLKRQLNKPKLIGLIGAAGSGKTTVGNIIERNHGFVKLRFASGIKSMLRALLFEAGIEHARIHEMLDGSLKESACDELAGKTPRFCMQTLGTEWGREFLSNNFWVDLTMHTVQRHLDVSKSVVIDDARFPNEVKAIKEAGGRVFRVLRDHDPIPLAAHKSEGQILEFDNCILNNGSIYELETQIVELL